MIYRLTAAVAWYGSLSLFAGIGVLAGPIALGIAATTTAALAIAEGFHHVR